MSTYRAFFGIKNIKLNDLEAAEGHNERSIPTENADPSRKDLNKVMFRLDERPMAQTVRELITQELKGKKPRKDAVAALEVACSFTSGADKALGFDVDEWARLSFNHVLAQVEGYPVRAWLHLDETSPHVHVIMVPITQDGRLCAKQIRGGKRELRERQTKYWISMNRYGLKRGVQKSGNKHKPMQRMYAEARERAQAAREALEALKIASRLPSIMPGETAEDYQKRAQEAVLAAMENAWKGKGRALLEIAESGQLLVTRENQVAALEKQLAATGGGDDHHGGGPSMPPPKLIDREYPI